jgi:hypothetical protein
MLSLEANLFQLRLIAVKKTLIQIALTYSDTILSISLNAQIESIYS